MVQLFEDVTKEVHIALLSIADFFGLTSDLRNDEGFIPFKTTIEFRLAFLAGLLIVIIFASKRLQEVITAPKSSDYEFVRKMDAKYFAGTIYYSRAFFTYVSLIILIYCFFCLLEPIGNHLMDISQLQNTISKADSSERYILQNPVWPLSIALIMVGLVPSTPIFDNVEKAIRQLAHRAADIPDRFLQSVDRIERSHKIQQSLLNEPYYADAAADYYRALNLMTLLGFRKRTREYFAQSLLYAEVMKEWTISKFAENIWSETLLLEFAPLSEYLKDNYDEAISKLKTTIHSTLSSKLTTEELKKVQLQTEDLSDEFHDSLIDADKTANYRELRKDLKQNWKDAQSDLFKISKQLSVYFVLLATNDKNIRISDKEEEYTALTKAIDVASSTSPNSDSNSIINGIVFGTISTFTIMFLLNIIFRYFFPEAYFANNQTIDSLISRSVTSSLETCTFLVIQFGVATLTALMVRYSSISMRNYQPYNNLVDIPTTQFITTALWCMFSCFVFSIATYLLFQASRGDFGTLSPWGNSPASKAYFYTMIMYIPWSIGPALYAILICFLIDKKRTIRALLRARSIYKNKPSNPATRAINNIKYFVIGYAFLIALIQLFVLFSHKNFVIDKPFIWTNVISILAFSTTSLLAIKILLARTPYYKKTAIR